MIAEREFLKLAFAFDHVNYSRYNSYQHVPLSDLKQKHDEAYSDLVLYGYGCTSTDRGKLRKIVKDKFRLVTSSSHKEMTPKNKIRHDHEQNLKSQLDDYNAEPFTSGAARNMVTGKEINPVVIDGLLGAAEKGDKKYKTFIEERLIKGEKSIFTPIKRANIKTGNKCMTKKLKKGIVLIEEKQAFGVMVAKCK